MVLSGIESRPGISRAEIARSLGFSDMAATRIVRELLAANLVEEFEERRGRAPRRGSLGRPKTGLRIAPCGAYAAGITLSAYHSEVSICDASGHLLHSTSIDDVPFGNPVNAARLFSGALKRLIVDAGIEIDRLVGVGVSLSARTDPSRGEITVSEYFGWSRDDGAFCREISDAIGVPVEIENIANALALAEMRFGAARDDKDFALVHAATFVGSCAISGGEVVRGAGGLSGQLGHVRSDATNLTCICGRHDCLNLTATGFGLVAKAHELDHAAFDTSKLAFYAASLIDLLGDSAAANDIENAGRKLAPALDIMGKLFAPSKIILGGYLGTNLVYFDGAKRELEETFGLGGGETFDLVRGTIAADRAAALLALHAFYYSDRLDFERLEGAPALESSVRV